MIADGDLSIEALRAEAELRDLAEHGTDLDNAAFFARRARANLRFNYSARRWMIFEKGRWKFDDSGQVMTIAKDCLREMHRQAANLKDEALRTRALKHVLASQSRRRLEAMIFLAQSELPISPAQLDCDPYAFNVLNGTLDLRTRELRAHNPEDFISKIAPVVFDPEAKCQRWERFIPEVMQGSPELVSFLQRFVGLCMTGVVLEHLFAIFYGAGSNGKTTTLDILGCLLGDYGAVVDPALFTNQHQQGPSPELVRLNGVRFVSASEIPEGGRFAEGRMKRLTGGDVVPARDLFSGVIEMKPSWKIAIATNHRPVVRDNSEGFWRRVRLVPFEAVFTGPQKDERLREKLLEELPGILNWALDGCLEWQAYGLGEPAQVRAATSIYRSDSDLIGAFLAESCILAEHAKVRATALYRAFTEWAKAGGERTVPTARVFRADLRTRGVRQRRSDGADILDGIGLLAEHGAHG